LLAEDGGKQTDMSKRYWWNSYGRFSPLEVLKVFSQIKSRLNLRRITTLYHGLRKSSYGASPLVTRLGWELSELGLVAL